MPFSLRLDGKWNIFGKCPKELPNVTAKAKENAKKAFDLRERVSEQERYPIEALYYLLVTGEMEKGSQTYTLWKQSYPHNDIPPRNLGDLYMRLGRWEKAQQETEYSLHLDPNVANSSSNLAWIQLALNHTAQAKATIEHALAHGMDGFLIRLPLYQCGFLVRDQQAMQQQLVWAAGRPKERRLALIRTVRHRGVLRTTHESAGIFAPRYRFRDSR